MIKILLSLVFVCLGVVLNAQSVSQSLRDFLNAGDYETLVEYAQNVRVGIDQASNDAIIDAAYEAEALIRLSRLEEAESVIQQELLLIGNASDEAKVYVFNAQGHLFLAKGRVGKALDQFQQSLTLAKGGGINVMLADCYNNLGVAYWTDSNNELAKEFLQKGLELRLTEFSETHIEVAGSYNNLGLIQSSENPTEALLFYQKALGIYQTLYGDQHPSVANTINNIALVHNQMGRRTQALRDFEKSRSIWQALHPKGHPNEAFVLSSMGQIYRDIQSLNQALKLEQEALAIYKQNFGEKHPEVAGAYNLIGVVYQDLGKLDSALISFQNAICANIPNYDKKDQLAITPLDRNFQSRVLLISLINKAEALEKRHFEKSLKRSDLKEALKNLQSCDTLVELIRHALVNEKDKIALGALASEVYESAIRISFNLSQITTKPQHYKELGFYFCEKSKSTVLLEAISDSKAKEFANIPLEVLEKEEALKSELAVLEQRLANEPANESSIRTLQFNASRAYEKFVLDLEVQFPAYYDLKYNAQPVAIEHLQNQLKEGTIVLNYFIATHSIYVFVVAKNKLDVFEIGLSPDFDRNITGFRNGIRYDDKEIIYLTSRALYKQLFPMRMKSSVQKVVVIPDGRLAVVPFEALIIKEANPAKLSYADFEYLMKKREVCYGYSATLFAANGKSQALRSNKSIFLCAPVSFQQRNPDLPGTAKECKSIDSLFREAGSTSAMYLEAEAQESIVKSPNLKNYDILHFATHGVVDEDNPGRSKIEFTLNEKLQDGDLFSAEIYNLNLNADLVTLSACQTGLGKISKGEGMIGLSRALLFAGAKNLIVSYWKVADESTSQLMISFYDYLIQSGDGNYSWALMMAKKVLIANPKTASPYYWAPFVLIGD